IDCAGNLWSVNPVHRKIFVNQSGEAGVCLAPWLTPQPLQGTVPPRSQRPVTLSLDLAGQPEGCREAQLVVGGDTPYDVFSVPVGLTIAFKDVPPTSKADKVIHGLATAGVVESCSAGKFCPSAPLTRRDAAGWLLRSGRGAVCGRAALVCGRPIHRGGLPARPAGRLQRRRRGAAVLSGRRRAPGRPGESVPEGRTRRRLRATGLRRRLPGREL